MNKICGAAELCKLRIMPDNYKEELLGDTRAVTAQEHKIEWYRSVIGNMCYYAVQARWDISFEVNRAA